jgi:hypothetical protein
MSSQQQQIAVQDLRSNWEADAAEYSMPVQCMPPWNAVCSELPWKPRCCPILGVRFKELSFEYPGVYRLIGCASHERKRFRMASRETENFRVIFPAVINRACGQDTTGTLYIGCGRPLSRRLNALRRSLHHGSADHGAPETLRYYARLNQGFPPDNLAIAVYPCFHCADAESDLLDAYINSFGEIPPLNLRWD